MLAFFLTEFIHWVDNQYAFNIGANWWQWITSIVSLSGWLAFFHVRFGEDRCQHCWRKGTIPVSGSVHKHCRHHAIEHGTTHT